MLGEHSRNGTLPHRPDVAGFHPNREDYAAANGLGRTRIIKLLPLTQLGPDILKAALTGTLPSRVTLNDLRTAAKQLD